MIILKAMLILVFGVTAYQDVKERMVSWVLFPIMASLFTAIYISQSSITQYALASLTNIALVSLVILTLWLYSQYIARKAFLNVSFGLGDLLFFYAFALGYPTLTFILLFACSLLFSLLLFALLNSMKSSQTVPLAGYMSIFLGSVSLVSLIPDTYSLYLL